jgi:hypothetical protein
LATKLLVMLLLVTALKHSRVVYHLKYDLSTWREFFDNIARHRIPYVDFSREYPVGAGVLYWTMAPLFIHVGEQQAVLAHAAVMAAFDVLNAGIFYVLARSVSPTRALAGTLVWSLSLTSTILSPLRFEAVLVTTLLIGYDLHRRGRNMAAAALFSLGATIKWFPAFLFVAQELKTYYGSSRRDVWWRSALVFGAVQIIANAPFLIASELRHHDIHAWLETYLYHVDRPLSVDTLLGMTQLWIGYIPWERQLAPATLTLLALTLLVRPRLPLTQKAVLLTIAMLICNRIYSPQFNLWFYPFLILTMLRSPRAQMLQLLALYVALDICNVLAYPLAFSPALDEMGSFAVYNAAEHGRAWTLVWSASIVLRCCLLLGIARLMLKWLAGMSLPYEQWRSSIRDESDALAPALGGARFRSR